jgi:hypothetical protein
MSALIEKFKKEHSEILAILNEVKKLGIHSQEGRSKLISAKRIRYICNGTGVSYHGCT